MALKVYFFDTVHTIYSYVPRPIIDRCSSLRRSSSRQLKRHIWTEIGTQSINLWVLLLQMHCEASFHLERIAKVRRNFSGMFELKLACNSPRPAAFVKQLTQLVYDQPPLSSFLFFLPTEFVFSPSQKLPLLVAAGYFMQWSWQRHVSLIIAAAKDKPWCLFAGENPT